MVRRITSRNSETEKTDKQSPQGHGTSGTSGPEVEEASRRKSDATLLIELCTAKDVRLFHTEEQTAYAQFRVGDHWQIWRLKSETFRDWLRSRYWQAYSKAVGGQAIVDAVGALCGIANFQSPEHPVYLRSAPGEDGSVWIDLCNEKWQAIHLQPRKWEPKWHPHVRFRRAPGMLPLPHPKYPGNLEALRPLLNLASEDDWRLLVAWLVAAVFPQGPYPVVLLNGVQGAGKSSFARLIRAILDPNKAPLSLEPDGTRDLAIAANNAWLLCYDNLSKVPDWLSDAFCVFSTGGSFRCRALFTDDDEKIITAQRPILLTSIEDVVNRGDLLERMLSLNLERIAKRRAERLVEAEFKRHHADILGGLLTLAANVLFVLPDIDPEDERLPRMADWARVGLACEVALDWEPGSFLAAYARNRDQTHSIALETSPLVMPLRMLMARKNVWEGTAAALLGRLTDNAPEASKLRSWPQAAHVLAGRLRRLAPDLLSIGIQVDFCRADKDRRITVRKLPEKWQELAPEASEAPDDPLRGPFDPPP